MKHFITIGLLFLFAACSTQAPTEQEIKTKVYEYYRQQSEVAGGNQYNVQGVNILSLIKDATGKNVFDVAALAKGTFSNRSLVTPVENIPFQDTLRMAMEWNGAKWITVPR
jgi:hypothetical protein